MGPWAHLFTDISSAISRRGKVFEIERQQLLDVLNERVALLLISVARERDRSERTFLQHQVDEARHVIQECSTAA